MIKLIVQAAWLLLGLFLFFAVFAFALNNRQSISVAWFFGYVSHIQLVVLVFLSFLLGVGCTLLAMLPLWWHQYKRARGLGAEQHSPSQLMPEKEAV